MIRVAILLINTFIFTSGIILATPSVFAQSATLDPWLDPTKYEKYKKDVLIYYIEDFQFGFRVRAVQKDNLQIIYPQEDLSSRMVFQEGEKVVFRVKTIDVVHGFNIFNYLSTSSGVNIIEPGKVYEFGPILLDKTGKFKVRDPVPCDALNPFEYAEIVVEPNMPHLYMLIGVAIVSVFTLLYLSTGKTHVSREVDLLRIPIIGRTLMGFVKRRSSTFLLQLFNLFIFVFIIVAGLFGNPTGGMNFSITVVWVLWFALVEFMIFFAGRLWCTMCPMPVLGEWISRRRVIEVSRRWLSLNREWPKSLDNMWIGALSFLGISLFIVWITTRPLATAVLFIIMLTLPIITHLYNPKRYFCKSVCPAMYISYHANASILAVRALNKNICHRHKTKECKTGSPTGYGCPFSLYPGGNDDSTYCGQCFECIRSCPMNNMTLKLRMPGRDIPKVAVQKVKEKIRYDEAWMGFIRFSLAIFYELIFFGTFTQLKDWGDMNRIWGANLASAGVLVPSITDLADWFKWAIIVSSVTLILFPSIFYLFSWLANKFANSDIETKKVFVAFSYSLVPYGLLLWMSFAAALFLVNWARPINSFIDPFGLHWNIFAPLNLEKVKWYPLFEEHLIIIQTPFLFAGLFLGLVTNYNIANELFKDSHKAIKATSVMALLHSLSAVLAIWIIAG